MENFLTSDAGLIRKEGWVANEHLKENGTNTPPIDCLCVARLAEHLWRDIVRRANCRVGQLSGSFIFNPLVVKIAIHIIWVTIIDISKVVPSYILMDSLLISWSNLNMLAKTEIAQLHVTVTSYQQIIWL